MFGSPEVSYQQTYSARDWLSILRTSYPTQNLQRKYKTGFFRLFIPCIFCTYCNKVTNECNCLFCVFISFIFTLHVSGSHKPIIRGLQYCNIVIRLPTDATVYFVYLFPLFLPYMFRALISPSSGVSRTVFFIYKHLVSVLDYIHLHTPPYTFNREAQTTGYTVEHTHTTKRTIPYNKHQYTKQLWPHESNQHTTE